MSTREYTEKSDESFLHSAQLLEEYTSEENHPIVGLHDPEITTKNQWIITRSYRTKFDETVCWSPIPDQIMFLLFIAAAEGEL